MPNLANCQTHGLAQMQNDSDLQQYESRTVICSRMVAWHHVLLTLLLRSVRLKRIHGNVCAIEGAAIANIDNPNWILDLRVSSCGFCCHLTGEDAAEIPQTFDCAAAELNALMMPGYHPAPASRRTRRPRSAVRTQKSE